MISYIRGILVQKTPTYVIVEASGVGFQLAIPLSSFQPIGETGDEVKILSYLHAREDGVRLFGFATEGERDLFMQLISVSGVGPRLAQGILSGISVEDFLQAIQAQDVETLMKTPGIGKKTAERLLLELKEKIGTVEAGRGPEAREMKPGQKTVIAALVSLGYKEARARESVEKVLQKFPGSSVEELIRKALQEM